MGRTLLDQRLWELRRTSRSLAEELDVHETQVSRWRSGLHLPEQDRREEIAKALKCDPSELWPELHEKAAA